MARPDAGGRKGIGIAMGGMLRIDRVARRLVGWVVWFGGGIPGNWD
ncbi:MAG: hypothetical protein AAGD22_03130 [Verrucomicrobiota bacterium]